MFHVYSSDWDFSKGDISYYIEDFVITLKDKSTPPIFLPNVLMEVRYSAKDEVEKYGFTKETRGLEEYLTAFMPECVVNWDERNYVFRLRRYKGQTFEIKTSKVDKVRTLREYYDMCKSLNLTPSQNIPTLEVRSLGFYRNVYFMGESSYI